jgi:DNA-binding HxlR family transcriptional regulator
VSLVDVETQYAKINDDLCRGFLSHLETVGRKWNGAILLAAVRGSTRFSQYRAAIEGISDRLLAQRLRELETEGFIKRTVTPTTPVLVEYRATERGRELMQLLQPLAEWGPVTR